MPAAEKKVKKKKLTFSDILTRILLATAVLLTGFIGVMVFTAMVSKSAENKETEDDFIRKNIVVVDAEMQQVYDEEQLNNVSDHDVKMNSEWTFRDGKTISQDAYVENPSSNKNSVYFDIQTAGTGDVVYTSPVLPPGSHLEGIVPDRILPAGDYDCILTYYLIGFEETQCVGELQMALKIKVQS